MKFGNRFEDDLQEAGWEPYYLRYRVLKNFIKSLSILDRLGDGEGKLGKRTIETAIGLALEEAGEPNEPRFEIKDGVCSSCLVRPLFARLLRNDVLRVRKFVRDSTRILAETFDSKLEGEVDELLERAKEKEVKRILLLDPDEMKTLASLGCWLDSTKALRHFVVVNIQAVEKIVKKFVRRTNELKGCCSGKEEFCKSDSVGDALLDELVNTFATELENIRDVRLKATRLETRIMVSSSAYNDFLLDHLTQLGVQHKRDRLARVERRKRLTTRITKAIDLETQMMPSAFLALAVTLPLVTLVCTYYISSSIYIDEENELTVFDEKGYFISASIDYAPAANIGTLGLNTALTLLSVVIFVKHKIVKKQLRGRVWMRTHRIACAFGLLATFCGNGVAAFQHQHNPVAHNTFAALFFLFGMLHVLLETIVDIRHSLSEKYTRSVRAYIAAFLVFCVFGFLAPMTYLLGGFASGDAALRSRIRSLAASFEVAAFACFTLWFGSYYPLMRACSYQLHVHRKVKLENDPIESLRLRGLPNKHHIENGILDSSFSQEKLPDSPAMVSTPSSASSSPSPPKFSAVEAVLLTATTTSASHNGTAYLRKVVQQQS